MYNVTITFNVNGQIISCSEKDTTLLSDSIDLIKARFNFSPEWQGYIKTAIFKSSTKKPYSKILVDDECMVPSEAIKKSNYMSVSVFGVSGTQLITATDQIVPLTPSGYTDDSIMPPAPVENIYQQMVTIMQKQAFDAVRAETAQDKAEKASNASTNSATAAATSATAATQSATAAANSASAAHTSETNAASSATSASTSASTATTKASQASTSATNAANSATAASNSSSSASTYATSALAYDTESKSYAVGGTGSRTGEDIDNSKYYAEQARIVSGTNAWIDFDANGYLTLYTKED